MFPMRLCHATSVSSDGGPAKGLSLNLVYNWALCFTDRPAKTVIKFSEYPGGCWRGFGTLVCASTVRSGHSDDDETDCCVDDYQNEMD